MLLPNKQNVSANDYITNIELLNSNHVGISISMVCWINFHEKGPVLVQFSPAGLVQPI